VNDYEGKNLLRATEYLRRVALRGGIVLFVGTKQPVCELVKREASRCRMPYVNDRWVGGTLTNFGTTLNRLHYWEKQWSLLETIVDVARTGIKRTSGQRAILREYNRMQRTAGLREMRGLPECLVIVDPLSEQGASGEARKMGITTIGLVEVGGAACNVNLAIPTILEDVGSIEFVVSRLVDAVLDGGWRV